MSSKENKIIEIRATNDLVNRFQNLNNYQETFKKLGEVFRNANINYEKIFENLPKSANIKRRTSLDNIIDAYKNQKLVLVLGAGVSLEFGVPTWNSLLQDLMVYTIEEESSVSGNLSKIFNELFKPNSLIAARYLQDYFEKNDTTIEAMVRNRLYSTINKDKNSKLLTEIVNMCVAPGNSPNIDSIITYNFDDILEYKLDNVDVEIPYKSVYGLGLEIKNRELPIYHVHGYLPSKKALTESNKITFGESNYHQQYSDLYSWNNMVQINKFRDNTCLFIGSSLSDPNIRRLLDIALKQKGNKRKHHYIFKERMNDKKISDDLKEIIKLSKQTNNVNELKNNFDDTIRLIIEMYERFEENDSASFGVQTIWINNWSEVPQHLNDIRRKVNN